MIIAQHTAWGLNELLDLTEDELMTWLDVCRNVNQRLQDDDAG